MRKQWQYTMMMLNHIKERQSFLSPEVEKLVKAATPDLESAEGKYSAQDLWVTVDGTIDWNKVQEALSGIEEIEESESWFRMAVNQLSPLLSQSHACLTKLQVSGRCYETFALWLNWTCQEEMLSMCIELLSGDEYEADSLLALLIVTAITERVMGDLVWRRQKQVPFLLRDLLLTPELNRALGVTRILTLRVLLGSVFGLNLRNLAWHGFLKPSHAHPAFTATLIIILADFGRCMNPSQDSRMSKSSMNQFRTLVSLEKGACLGLVFKDIPMVKEAMEEIVVTSPLVPSVMVSLWHRVIHLVQADRCDFGLVLLLPLLECSLRYLFAMANRSPHRLLTAQTSAFYTTLDQILDPFITVQESDNLNQPKDLASLELKKDSTFKNLIECGASKIVNQVASQKQVANSQVEPTDCDNLSKRNDSQASGYYEIQKQKGSQFETVELGCGTLVSEEHKSQRQGDTQLGPTETNYVLPVIGRKINEALHDLLNFIQGPRVRDRISHGEVNFREIPSELTYHVLCLSIGILSLGASTQTDSSDSCRCDKIQNCACDIKAYLKTTKFSDKTCQYIVELRRCIDNYKVKYHVSALLHKKITDCFSFLGNWMSWKRVNITDLEYDVWVKDKNFDMPEVLVCHSLEASHRTASFSCIPEVIEEISHMDYSVLYRPKVELEVLSLLHKITRNICISLENIQENLSVKYSQFVEKKLRSRQRETYRRQLNSIPKIVASLFLSSQVVYLFFSSVKKFAVLESERIGVLMKILRTILKVQENVVSYTSLDTNRWEEALRISEENLVVIKEKFAG